jgi:hypothetical protein
MVRDPALLNGELHHGEGHDRPAQQRKNEPARDYLIPLLQLPNVTAKTGRVGAPIVGIGEWQRHICRARGRRSRGLEIDVGGSHT